VATIKDSEAAVDITTLAVLCAIAAMATDDIGNYDALKEQLNFMNITEPMLDNTLEFARKHVIGK